MFEILGDKNQVVLLGDHCGYEFLLGRCGRYNLSFHRNCKLEDVTLPVRRGCYHKCMLLIVAFQNLHNLKLLVLLKLSLTIDLNNLWVGRFESDLLAILRVSSSLAATLSNPLEILAMVVSSSSSSANMRVPSSRAFLSISGLLKWILVKPFHTSFFKLHKGAMGSQSSPSSISIF